MRPTIHLLSQPTLAGEGFALRDFGYLRDPLLQKQTREVYASFVPARNATNCNPRGLRWGIYIHDEFRWLDRDTYALSEKLNPEEGGRVRRMDLIPESLLRTRPYEALFRETFKLFDFNESSASRAYEIQISAIRYAPEPGRSATPPPPYPHHDEVDGAVVVLAKENVIGGISRIFDNSGNPLYEFDLNEGNGFLIKDAELMHYVSDVQLALGTHQGYRDIMIVRFQPMGRGSDVAPQKT